MQVICQSLPDGAGGRGQRRAKRPDVLLVLLHGGNADLEGGDVGQQRPRGKRGLLPLFVLLRLQQRHKLDLDDGAGKTKHTPRGEQGGKGVVEVEEVEEKTTLLRRVESLVETLGQRYSFSATKS